VLAPRRADLGLGRVEAQALGMQSVGAADLHGCVSRLGQPVVAPFAWREWRTLAARIAQPKPPATPRTSAPSAPLLFLGAAMQQSRQLTTTVTNAGFLTALYVPLVPVIAWLAFRHRPALERLAGGHRLRLRDMDPGRRRRRARR
jgi:hypothetical protein